MRSRYLGGLTLLLGLTGVIADTQRILWGQCYSNCLTRYLDESVKEEGDSRLGSNSLIKTCRKTRECKTCLFACDRSPLNYTSIDSCLHDCDKMYPSHESCKQSCRFLSAASKAKAGNCMKQTSMEKFERACVEQCHDDSDCAGIRKCCDNGCGFTCQRPRNDRTLPRKPIDIEFDARKDGNIIIKWDLPSGKWLQHVTKPFVYIVRWRMLDGVGVNYVVTDRTMMKLRGVIPASTINVIVACVNVHGSRGFTTISKHTKEFTKPSPPVNFEEGATTLHDGLVDVEIMWQPPHQTDGLAISRYVVQRSEGLPMSSAQYHRVNMRKYRISPNRHKFVLRDLKPATRYFVQVFATVRWRDKVQKGRAASLYIVTYSPPTQVSSTGTPKPAIVTQSEKSAIYNITIDQSFYHQGVLKTRVQWKTVSEEIISKYLVYWRATSCDKSDRRKFRPVTQSATTHEEQFNLYNLHYSCNYSIVIKPVNSFNDVLAASTASFTTPHCIDIAVQGKIRPHCPQKVSNIPGRPPDIQIHHLVDKCSVDIAVVWEIPLSREAIIKYSILWGESQEVALSSRQVVYNKHPRERVISGNITELILTDLAENRHFTVQISASSRSGEGDKAVRHFKTRGQDQYCKHSTQSDTEISTAAGESQTKTSNSSSVECRPGSDRSQGTASQKCSGSHLVANWTLVLFIVLSLLPNLP